MLLHIRPLSALRICYRMSSCWSVLIQCWSHLPDLVPNGWQLYHWSSEIDWFGHNVVFSKYSNISQYRYFSSLFTCVLARVVVSVSRRSSDFFRMSRSRLDTVTPTSQSRLRLETLTSRYCLGLGIIRFISKCKLITKQQSCAKKDDRAMRAT